MSIAMTIIMHAATEFEYAHDDLNEWICGDNVDLSADVGMLIRR